MAGLHSPSLPATYSRRHPNTWFALTPCARATRATDAPGASVSSTTPRRSATLRRRRFDSATTVPLANTAPTTPVLELSIDLLADTFTPVPTQSISCFQSIFQMVRPYAYLYPIQQQITQQGVKD